MTVTPEIIKSLIEEELSNLDDSRVIAHIRCLLVEPEIVFREWEYGIPGETFPTWTVLEDRASNTGIAYSEFGFGPQNPWGVVMLSSTSRLSFGMDCGWSRSLIDAYFESMADELPIWRVFKQEAGQKYPGFAVTIESDRDSTWQEVYKLRSTDPSSRYNCWHSI